ncbi:hypothetical protein ASG89_11470 [Paenibacillus sp. Soil766]|uniref:dynamin family protein n=1 Tax=Paenibacillus sp. Soil766 TaxID=1736404 RepID=UPI00070D0063|nr:dynamin family protein [Paenibacillus sp. Soil766]KRE83738.1 hypothetical protein ASG89_11470 [Paenibacillus sp. Soil766]
MKTQNLETISKYIRLFENITDKYKVHQDVLGLDHYHTIAEFSSSFRKDAEYVLEENRKLKIGVVGQIKAGKSSFLNALLFDGKDVLPKASTPMTAALTVITYADSPRAEIEFFTREEWDVIHSKAKKLQELIDRMREKLSEEPTGGIARIGRRVKEMTMKKERKLSHQEIIAMLNAPDELKAAHELVLSVQQGGLRIDDYLGTTIELAEMQETSQLIGELQQYVGAEGKFTPIVKSTILYIPDESLQHMDIVDTPGINDPILSRGQRTRDYLGQCDVVFLLSYTSQFMDSVDVELLTQNIPDKGIVNILLVGSKFDLVLYGDGNKYPSLRHALKYITDKLQSQAENTIMPMIRMYPDNPIMQSLRNSMPPIFVSSMAYTIGKHMQNLSNEQQHVLKLLQGTFATDKLTPELLIGLSNIEQIRDVRIPEVQSRKEEILKNRFGHLLMAQQDAFIKQLSNLMDELRNDLRLISESSGEDIEKTYKAVVMTMERARKEVDLIFDNFITKVKKKFNELQTEFKSIAQNYRRFQESKESRREFVKSERYGFLWLKSRDVYENRTYSYANVHQTIDQVADFAIELEKGLKSSYDEIMNLEKLVNDLKTAMLRIHDLSDESFDFNEVIVPVQKTINKISLPTFDLDSGVYRKRITDKFGMGKVEGGDVEKLKQLFYEQTDVILNDTTDKMNLKLREVEHSLQEISSDFINDVLKESEAKRNKLQKSIQNRDQEMRKYEEVLALLKQDIENFNKMVI